MSANIKLKANSERPKYLLDCLLCRVEGKHMIHIIDDEWPRTHCGKRANNIVGMLYDDFEYSLCRDCANSAERAAA